MAPIQCYRIDSKPQKTSYPGFVSSEAERWKALDGVKDRRFVHNSPPHPNPYAEVLTAIVKGFENEAFGR